MASISSGRTPAGRVPLKLPMASRTPIWRLDYLLDALLGGCDDGVVGVVVLLEAQGLAVQGAL
jgi:hypothetical protein